jgi:diguanylate cyclase (GGDEF)-like protein
VTVTVSIGVAALGLDGEDLFELLAAADAALYRAKKSGRDRVCTLPPGAGPSDPLR